MKLHLFILCFAACLVTTKATAQGVILPDGVTFQGYNGFAWETFVRQSGMNADYTVFAFWNESPISFSFAAALDESVRVFLVGFNQPISLQPILNNNYAELTYPNSYTFANGSTFYLGLYSGYRPFNGVYEDPVFGWGRFRNVNGTLSMLDSALVYGAGGIYAGTLNIIPVPEPAAWALLALGGAGLWAMRRRRGEGGAPAARPALFRPEK